VFTAPAAAEDRTADLAQSLAMPITPLGCMMQPSRADQPRVEVRDERGRLLRLAAAGWTHFGD
jgi:hypothetical protein